VEEDIAFDLENFGTPPEQIPVKIEQALQAVGMSGLFLIWAHRLHI